jgi:hypothetical protein
MERYRTPAGVGLFKINGCLLYNPSPAEGDLIDLALAYAMKFPKDKIDWTEIGPDLLTAIAQIYPAHGYQIKGPDFVNAINWWDAPDRFLADTSISREAKFVHLYNQRWTQKGIDKNFSFPPSMLIGKLIGQYCS